MQMSDWNKGITDSFPPETCSLMPISQDKRIHSDLWLSFPPGLPEVTSADMKEKNDVITRLEELSQPPSIIIAIVISHLNRRRMLLPSRWLALEALRPSRLPCLAPALPLIDAQFANQ